MRKYRPFLIYSPARGGWGFYSNRMASSFTSRTIGKPDSRRIMRKHNGWFLTAQLAAMMEAAERRI